MGGLEIGNLEKYVSTSFFQNESIMSSDLVVCERKPKGFNAEEALNHVD